MVVRIHDTRMVNNVSGKDLLTIIERLENLDDHITELQSDKKDVYGEANSQGFDPKIIRKIIQIRKRDTNDVEQEETLLEVYQLALGMISESQ